MQHTQTATAPVPIGELLDAWLALQRGAFRQTPPRGDTWVPADGETAVVAIGCLGSAGTSTVALALASAAGESRVIECASGACSGLAGAATAELGTVADGWIKGAGTTCGYCGAPIRFRRRMRCRSRPSVRRV